MELVKLIKLQTGHYIVAVSGGVDSMVLMHLISGLHNTKGNGLSFTVAHFDHGIREESHLDRILTAEEATRLHLPFIYEETQLGPNASEEEARLARYEFLKKVQEHTNARAILTAHHYDDVIETAVLNIYRGTGRKGMTSLASRDGIIRPLINVSKSKLRDYALANDLTWHEDGTNIDQKYRRNYIRHSVLSRMKQNSPADYKKLSKLIKRQYQINQAIDNQLDIILHSQPSRRTISRQDVISLPYVVATELVAQWLRQNGKRDFNRWLIDRVTVSIRTSRSNTEFLVDYRSKISFGLKTADFINIIN